MGALFVHMPFWVYWLIFGLFLAVALVLVYERWPTWVKTLAFIFTVLGWPITAVGWVLWGAVLRPEKGDKR